MLGVSLGSDEKVAAFVESKIFAKLTPMVERLSDFDDLQSAFFLLRVSFTIVRATHFMRSTPLNQWRDQAVRFDGAIRRAAESILGAPLNDQSYRQAALTPRLGGLGLRRVVDHADIAFAASRHEAQITSEEKWLPREGVVIPYSLRKSALSARIKRSCKISLQNPQILGKVNAFGDSSANTLEHGSLLSPQLSMGTTR